MHSTPFDEDESSPFDTIRKFLSMTEEAAVKECWPELGQALDCEDTGEHIDQFTFMRAGWAHERGREICYKSF
jgi:hypothetical protein